MCMGGGGAPKGPKDMFLGGRGVGGGKGEDFGGRRIFKKKKQEIENRPRTRREVIKVRNIWCMPR